MNWTYFSLGTSIFVGCLANWINESANAAYRKNAAAIAEGMKSEETLNQLKAAESTVKLADEVTARESREISKELATWDIKNDYNTRINEIHKSSLNEIDTLKESINYYARKDEIENTAETAIEDFKEDISYDEMMALYNGKISSATSSYKRKAKLYDLAGSDDDDTVSELKKIEKKKMEEVIEEVKAKKSELNVKLEKEQNRINRQKNNDLRALEAEVNPGKNAIMQKEREATALITKERDAALNSIRENVHSKRSESEIKALNEKWNSQKFIDDQKISDTRNALDVYRNASTSDKWGAWLKANDVPKWLVALIAALPLIPAGFIVERYFKFVINTIKAM